MNNLAVTFKVISEQRFKTRERIAVLVEYFYIDKTDLKIFQLAKFAVNVEAYVRFEVIKWKVVFEMTLKT